MIKKIALGSIFFFSLALGKGSNKIEVIEDKLNKQYSYIEVHNKHYDLEHKLSYNNNSFLLEIEIEDNFFKRDSFPKDKAISLAKEVSLHLRKKLKNPIKIIVSYNDNEICQNKI